MEDEDSIATKIKMLMFQVFSCRLYWLIRRPLGLSGTEGNHSGGLTCPWGQMVTESASYVRLWCSDFPESIWACLSLHGQRLLLEDVKF